MRRAQTSLDDRRTVNALPADLDALDQTYQPPSWPRSHLMETGEPQELREDPGGFIDRTGKSSFDPVAELEQTLQARAHSIAEEQVYKGSPDRRRLTQQTQSEREDGNELAHSNTFSYYPDQA